jgi:hypothetical protein
MTAPVIDTTIILVGKGISFLRSPNAKVEYPSGYSKSRRRFPANDSEHHHSIACTTEKKRSPSLSL